MPVSAGHRKIVAWSQPARLRVLDRRHQPVFPSPYEGVTMVRVVVFLACALFLISGCGKEIEKKAVEKAIEKASGDQIDELSIGGEREARIPTGFPEDVYIFTPSTIEVALKVPQGFSVSLLVEDRADAVAEKYRTEMAAQGWTERTTMDLGEVISMSFAKDSRVTNVAVAGDNGDSRVSVTVMLEQ